MADGTSKLIEDLKPGDEVIATDAESGETQTETITATLTSSGTKHFVKIVIDPDGDTGAAPAEVTATDNHPFWLPELGIWIHATDLTSGQWLRTSTGTWVQIKNIIRWTEVQATVHNLTVSDLHTYYAVADSTEILVHNCTRPDDSGLGLPARASKTSPTTGQVVQYGPNGWEADGKQVSSGGGMQEIHDFLAAHPDMPSLGINGDGRQPAQDHVEAKVAWAMRKRGITSVDLVINNSSGVCTGAYTCRTAVPLLLPAGSTLRVWYRTDDGRMLMHPFKGMG